MIFNNFYHTHQTRTDGNKIKFIHGGTFQKHSKLTDVYLGTNACINEDFFDPTRIEEMPEIITRKCGSDESVYKLIEKVFEGQKRQIEAQESFMNITLLEKEICQSEIIAKTEEIAKVNAELAAEKLLKDRFKMNVKVTRDRCDSQFEMFKDLNDKRATQFYQMLTAKTEDLNDLVFLKSSENEKLFAELQDKKEEINEKDLKIKILEERVQALEGQNDIQPTE